MESATIVGSMKREALQFIGERFTCVSPTTSRASLRRSPITIVPVNVLSRLCLSYSGSFSRAVLLLELQTLCDCRVYTGPKLFCWNSAQIYPDICISLFPFIIWLTLLFLFIHLCIPRYIYMRMDRADNIGSFQT
ncbi:hypothetical protein SAMN04489735_1006128 [Aneurinibacillus thermoaerophilus]|uniref:Uncharacterized protein n=1 Tax=Aneurinibacillus thermoaerophilus TaxID=143495 RepID=A0A1G7YG25_ANETH|nr:hypothetical protein SAMN04489735_1006128 [Aneurinibacillus thermoaerophilus]